MDARNLIPEECFLDSFLRCLLPEGIICYMLLAQPAF